MSELNEYERRVYREKLSGLKKPYNSSLAAIIIGSILLILGSMNIVLDGSVIPFAIIVTVAGVVWRVINYFRIKKLIEAFSKKS
jgi:hypothetical protein